MPKYLNTKRVIFPRGAGRNKEKLMFTFRSKKEELTTFLMSEEAEKIYDDLQSKLGSMIKKLIKLWGLKMKTVNSVSHARAA